MSEAFLSHPARETVRAILALEASPQFSDSVVTADKHRRIRDLCFATAHAVQGLFERSVPQLVSIPGLNQVHGGLQGVLNELTAYVSNSNPGHISNASPQCDQVLQQLWAFGPQVEQIGKRALGEIFKFQEKSSNTFIEQLKEQHKELAGQMAETLKRASDLQSQLDSFKNVLSKTEAEAAAAVAKLDTQFNNDERERTNEFQEKLAEISRRATELSETLSGSADSILADLKAKQADAAKIVQVVGNIGITGNYQRIANDESDAANTWRRVTVGIFVVGIGLALTSFWKFLGEPFTSETFWSIAVRLLFSIAVTGPAWYTAKESARHRTNADRARKLELELASLGPFIELLPDEQKNQIRENLTRIYFGGSDIEPHTPGSMVNISELKDAIVDVLKVAKK